MTLFFVIMKITWNILLLRICHKWSFVLLMCLT